MNQEFMKEKPILPLVVSMALPMTLSMLVNALYNIIDSYFVAKISEEAMTALSLVYPIQNLVGAVLIGFGIGMNAVIAYYLGAGRQEKADAAASLGVALNILHGLALMVFCFFVMPPFLRMFTDNEQIVRMGLEYSNIVFLFNAFNGAGLGYEKIFQAVGRMKTSMVCMLLGCVTNIILDPLMIFGIGVFPEMGMRGAAAATGIGQTVSLLAYLVFYVKKPIPVRVRPSAGKMDAPLVGKMYSVGVPATLNLALPSLQVSVLNAILAAYSAAYVLVLGAYFKLQTFLYLTGNGVVQGMRPLIGYNYGAGERERVRGIFLTALGLIAGVMAAGTVLCLVMPGALIGLFTENPQTVALGEEALRFICAGFLVSAVSVTVSGALEGLGMGAQSLVISLLRYIVLMLPFAFLFSRPFGAAGVWNAFWVTEALSAVVSWGICRKKILIK